MCQGFSHFSVCLHHFVLAKLATTSMRVKISLKCCYHAGLSATKSLNEKQAHVFNDGRFSPRCSDHASLAYTYLESTNGLTQMNIS